MPRRRVNSATGRRQVLFRMANPAVVKSRDLVTLPVSCSRHIVYPHAFRRPGFVKALVITRPATIELKDPPRPSRADQCLIRSRRAGICGTDLQLPKATPISSASPGTNSSASSKGACRRCRVDRQARRRRNQHRLSPASGAPRIREHCDNRSVVGIRLHDGAFAGAPRCRPRTRTPCQTKWTTILRCLPNQWRRLPNLRTDGCGPGVADCVVGDGRMDCLLPRC
jgi:hypothetical protein